MKIKGAKQVHYDAGPNMTPLVDVVMVILIFLMLAGKFGGSEQYLQSSTPIKKGGGGVTDAISKDTEFAITVDALPDRFVARVGDQSVSDQESLVSLLKDRAAAFTTSSPDGTLNNIQVVIDPGRTVKYMYLIQAYEAANIAGFPKVAFQQAH